MRLPTRACSRLESDVEIENGHYQKKHINHDCRVGRLMANRSNRRQKIPSLSEGLKPDTTIGSWRAINPLWSGITDRDAAARDRIYVSSRTYQPKNGLLANEVESIYGRQVAAWIGLVPGQYSSGGKARLGRITKAGDNYLRSLLVMGARAVLNSIGDKQDRFSRWARSLQERRGYWRAVIAIAAKNARLAWAVLKYGEDFKLAPDNI
jgi:hypothetical protein